MIYIPNRIVLFAISTLLLTPDADVVVTSLHSDPLQVVQPVPCRAR